ncbi:tape measure protein [Corynebacterium macginleyi]|uniref:tape measure protein n=1 Tax=Corynebacterium macginleyi TaxID=38290 RepID=UPI0019099C85|nr:tape measure protein [Corynebacterium macginleyi]MBK4183141.1 tape measure protein [Corynebacterium macginleyi]
MAALDLGDLGFTITVDTGDFDRQISQVEQKARQADQSFERLSRKTIAPKSDTGGVEKLERSTRKADSALDKTSKKKVAPQADTSGVDKIQSSTAAVSSELDKVANKRVSPRADSAPLERAAGAAKEASSSLDQTAASVSRVGGEFDSAGASTDTFSSKLRNNIGKLGGFAAGIAGVAGAAQVMQNGFSKVTSIEDTTKALGVMMGSADEASVYMDKLVESNMRSTYSFDAWANAGKTLVAFGIEAEQASQTVTALGEAAAATGKGEEALLNMSDAFGQAAASGKISMETLNRLADGGVQGLAILANHFGVTTEEMQKMISSGAVPAEEGIKALTDGIINGSEGAAGSVQSLSGVMGEMAETTSGTLKNMGAELNNTAAAVFERLSPAIKSVADQIRVGAQGATKFIKDIDVSPIVSMGEAIMNLPGPVKDAAKALVAFKLAQAALNTTIGQNAVGKVTAFKTAIMDTGRGVQDLKAYYAATGREISTFTAATQLAATSQNSTLAAMGTAYNNAAAAGTRFSKSTGLVKAGMAGIKSAASGVIGMLGGPWGAAFIGAAAVVSQISSANEKAKSIQDSYTQATDNAAKAQDRLNASLAGTKGALNEAQLTDAADMVEKDLNRMKTIAEEFSGWFNTVEAPDLSWWQQGHWSSDWREYASSVNEAKDSYEAIESAAGKLKIPMDDLNRVVAEGGPQYDSLISSLRDSGDAGNAAADQLEGARNKIQESIDAARDLDPAAAQAAAGIDVLADSSASAEDKLSALKSTMQAMGLMVQTADQANMEAAEHIDELSSKMAELVNHQYDIGAGLFDGDKLDYTNENARALSDTLGDMSNQLMNVATSGGDINGIWEQMVPQLESLREHMGLAGAEFDEQWSHVLESYGLAPDVVRTLVELDGASEAVQSLGDVWTALYPLEEGTSINIDPPDGDVLKAMDEIGIKYQEVKNDAGETIQYKITAPNDEAMGQLESLTAKMAEIDDESVTIETIMDTTPLEFGADEARAIVDQLDIQEASPTAQLLIDQLLANGEIARGDLEYLNQQSPTPVAGLDKLLLDAGVSEAHRQLDGVDKRSTNSKMKGDNSDVISKAYTVISLLNSISPTKTITFVGRKIGEWLGHEHGGRIGVPTFMEGGEIPALAGGGYPAGVRSVGRDSGYKLPKSGPGTEQVDGFLGVNGMGQAVARVNAGEWVINNNSSDRYHHTLQGINRNNPRMILAGLAAELPALADGGRTKSADVIEQLQPYNNGPYVMGGFSPSSMDCSGAVSAVVNTWLGLNPFDSRMSTVTEGSWLAAKGFEKGRGNGNELVVGWYDYGGGANGHTALMLPDGTYIESGGNTGQGFTIGGSAGPLDGRGFTNFMYLPNSGDEESGPTGDGGVTINGNGTDLDIADFGGSAGGSGGAKRASHTNVSAPALGSMFDAPGLASNRPGGTVGGSIPSAQKNYAYALAEQAGIPKWQVDNAFSFANPFVGQNSYRDLIGEPAAQQILSIAKQLENAIGQGGIEAQVAAALDVKTPNWDVWLRVNDETIDAFNQLGEAQAARKNASMDITEAEEKLADLRKRAVKSDEEATEKLAEAYKNLDKAKNKDLSKSYTQEQKNEDIEKAEKKIRELKEKSSDNEVKAAQQIAEAERDLIDAREAEKKAIRELEQAQIKYNTALVMAPIKAVASLTDHIAAGLGTVADTLGIMAENMDKANAVADARQQSELENINAQKAAMDAAQALRKLEREGANARHAEVLAQQQAEFDLAMARHDHNGRYADLEVNLADIRTKGILDVSQRALDTDRLAMLSASTVAVAEKQLELTRAESAQNEWNRHIQMEEATYELNYQQEMARIQNERLKVATQEMANAAAEAANKLGIPTSAIAREQQGKQKQAKGAVGVIGGLAQLAGAGAMVAATQGFGAPMAMGLAISGLKSLVQGSTSIAEGTAQRKAYKKQAREEYEQLSPKDKRRVDIARAGLVAGALAGGAVGAAGGTFEDVGGIFDATSGAFNLPLYKKQMENKYGAEAAALLTAKAKAELDRRQRKAEIERARKHFDLKKETNPQTDMLAEMRDTLQRQLDELQQENKQLAGVNDKLDRGNKSVLMSIGGSGWGVDSSEGMILSQRERGFGEISREDVGAWSSLNVENGWNANALMRPIVDSVADTAADAAAAAGRGLIEGLPETVVEGLYANRLGGSDVVPGALNAAQRSSMASEEARRQAAYRDAANRVLESMGGGNTTNIDTQFTGAVTVNAQLEDKVMAGLSSMVKQR